MPLLKYFGLHNVSPLALTHENYDEEQPKSSTRHVRVREEKATDVIGNNDLKLNN